MICSFRVRLTMARGALVRVIRLVEHRSARIVDIDVRGAAAEGRAVIELTVEGKVPAMALARQIEKLYDVNDVAIVDSGLD